LKKEPKGSGIEKKKEPSVEEMGGIKEQRTVMEIQKEKSRRRTRRLDDFLGKGKSPGGGGGGVIPEIRERG